MVDVSDPVELQKLVHSSMWGRYNMLVEQIVNIYGRQVLTGPFAGMKLPNQVGWSHGDVAAKLLGCYEAELHDWLERGIKRAPDIVIVVGCAEGYYAVGLARRLPGAIVYAYDISEVSQGICRENAELNGVADRVIVGGRCEAQQIYELVSKGVKALIVMDCEGDEKVILDENLIKSLGKTDIIIECHDNVNDRTITPTLQYLFEKTGHYVEIVEEGPRNPNAYPCLRSMDTFDRWFLVCEFRGAVMHWLASWALP